jgi:signal transduction histidine kinase
VKVSYKLVILLVGIAVIPLAVLAETSLALVAEVADAQSLPSDLTQTYLRDILANVAVTVVIVALIAVAVAKSLSTPIEKLRKSASEIAQGNLDVQVRPSTSDEIGELTTQFDYMRKQIIRDRNELKEQAEELRKSQLAKQEFASMVTHELKTPLVPIIGYGSMFLGGQLGKLTPEQRKKLEIMYSSAERLTRLIQDVLDVQKLDLGQMHFDMERISARRMIEDSVSSLKPQAEAKGVSLLNCLNGDATLTCDYGRIMQVLNNLINNGIKFSPGGGKIEIDASLKDGSVVFSVKDEGIGIPKDKQDRLFTKFYQVDTSMTRKAGGTGLGLVICKGIVEAHKGRIWFESEEGKGSIFTFSIPVGETFGKEKSASG